MMTVYSAERYVSFMQIIRLQSSSLASLNFLASADHSSNRFDNEKQDDGHVVKLWSL